MKTKASIVIALAFGAMVSGSPVMLRAQERPDRREAVKSNPQLKEALKELHQTMKDYAKANIIPTLRTWKAEFDKSLSAEDLKTLNDLRARAKALRAEKRELMKTVHESYKNGDKEALKNNREKFEALAEKHKAIMTELKPLVEKNKTTLQSMGEKAKPTVEQWRTKTQEILEQWKQKHSDILSNLPPMMGNHFGHAFGFEGRKKMVVKFLLWDGTEADMNMQAPQGGAELE